MRIIGGSDYYDSAMSQGIDMTLVYLRQNERLEKDLGISTRFYPQGGEDFEYFSHKGEIDTLKVTLPEPVRVYAGRQSGIKKVTTFQFPPDIYGWQGYAGPGSWYDLYVFDPITVIFCGKVYRGIAFRDETNTNNRRPKLDSWFAWSHQSLKTNLGKMDIILYPSTIDFFQPTSENAAAEAKMVELGACIAIYNPQWKPVMGKREYEARWFIDPPLLRQVGFQQLMDPYTAFQELSMYLGNRARPENSMITISDKSKIIKHGMDKWSFRRMKGQKA